MKIHRGCGVLLGMLEFKHAYELSQDVNKTSFQKAKKLGINWKLHLRWWNLPSVIYLGQYINIILKNGWTRQFLEIWNFSSCGAPEPVYGMILLKGQSFKKLCKHFGLLTTCSFSIIITVSVCAYVEWEVHSCSSITYYEHSYFYSIAFICRR